MRFTEAVRSLLYAIAVVGSVSIASAAEPVSLFNGKDLSGWKGREDLWSVKDGAITGRTSDDKPIMENTFLVSEKEVGDFDLTFEYRIEHGNSGVQYRSKVLDQAKFVVGGYQADIEAQTRYSGINYEEQGRGILADRGQITLVKGDKPEVAGQCGDSQDLQKHIKSEDWNTYRIIAVGGQMRHIINGVLMSEVIDLSDKAKSKGVLALQLHRGPAMVVQFRKLELTEL